MTCDFTTSNTIHPFLVMRLKQFLPSPISASSGPTQFDYLSHVRHINHPRYGERQYRFWTDGKFLSTEESAYIEEHSNDVVLQCQLDDVTVAPDFSRFMQEKELAYYLHEINLFRKTTWALANPILDQLESLTVPLSDVHRYREVGK